jgi:hypothetical protein
VGLARDKFKTIHKLKTIQEEEALKKLMSDFMLTENYVRGKKKAIE